VDLRELSDREQIRELRGRYSHYFDSGDLDSLVTLFAEDALCDFPPEHGGRVTGRERIREVYARYSPVGMQPVAHMHATTNQWIVVTSPDSAAARWFLLAFDLNEGAANPLVLVGIYDDEYRRVAGEWKIQSTRVDFIWPLRNFTGGVPGKTPHVYPAEAHE
jgi:ketosteroid isomerase-like protein